MEKNALATDPAQEPLLVGRIQQSTADANAFLAYQSNKVYFVGSYTDNSFGTFTEELDCKVVP